MLPNLFLLGVQKSGTTWMHHQLVGSSEVFSPRIKEHFFWTRPSEAVREGLDDYKKMFIPGAEKDDVRWNIDSTATYFWLRRTDDAWDDSNWQSRMNYDTISNIKSMGHPNPKFIISLRSPISRSISAFYHAAIRNRIGPSANILGDGRQFGIVPHSRYKHSIDRWMSEFGRDDVFVYQFRDIVNRPQALLSDVAKFLDLDETSISQKAEKRRNVGVPLREVDGRIVAVENSSASSEESADTYVARLDYPTVSQRDVDCLAEIFDPDITYLEQHFGWDLESWRSTELGSVLSQ